MEKGNSYETEEFFFSVIYLNPLETLWRGTVLFEKKRTSSEHNFGYIVIL
jgi:hypothetical protein